MRKIEKGGRFPFSIFQIPSSLRLPRLTLETGTGEGVGPEFFRPVTPRDLYLRGEGPLTPPTGGPGVTPPSVSKRRGVDPYSGSLRVFIQGVKAVRFLQTEKFTPKKKNSLSLPNRPTFTRGRRGV